MSGSAGAIINRIHLQGFLSFADDASPLELQMLNVFVGPNGSGKSNVLQAIKLFKSATASSMALSHEILKSGAGVSDWIWNGAPSGDARLSIALGRAGEKRGLRYYLRFHAEGPRLAIVDERLDDDPKSPKGVTYLHRDRSVIELRPAKGGPAQTIQKNPEGAIPALAVVNLPELYPAVDRMRRSLDEIQLFTDPVFGPESRIRFPQSTGGSNARLESDGENLALVLARMLPERGMRDRFAKLLREAYPYAASIDTLVEANRIRVIVAEGDRKVSADRLSDGTMRFIFLLAVLLDPAQTGPVFIDEADLGFHPDALRAVAELLKEVSKHRQIIVTTHNVSFLNHFTDRPDAVVAFDHAEAAQGDVHGTTFRRIEAGTIPEDMLVGEAWQRGLIGGTRW